MDLYLHNKGLWQKHSVEQRWSPAEISHAGRKSVSVNTPSNRHFCSLREQT